MSWWMGTLPQQWGHEKHQEKQDVAVVVSVVVDDVVALNEWGG